MLPLKQQKTWENFMMKIQNLSHSRKVSIIASNTRFNDFCITNYGKNTNEIISHCKGLNDLDELEDIIANILQGFLNQLHSTGLVVSTIIVYLTDVNRYLKYHRIRIELKELEWPQQLKEEPYAISRNEILEILKVAKWNKQGYYLALISTGARPVEILGLRKKDFTWNHDENRYTAIIPAFLTKKKIARTVMFSSEVTPYIGKMLKNIQNDDDTIFCTNPNLANARTNEDIVFLKYCRKIGFNQKYETTKRNKINLYCFRAYFFTRAQKVHDSEIAHAMIGHGAYLQVYQRRTLQEKIELWRESEPEMLINDQSKNNEKIKRLEDANRQLKEREEAINDLKKQMDTLQQMQQRHEMSIQDN